MIVLAKCSARNTYLHQIAPPLFPEFLRGDPASDSVCDGGTRAYPQAHLVHVQREASGRLHEHHVGVEPRTVVQGPSRTIVPRQRLSSRHLSSLVLCQGAYICILTGRIALEILRWNTIDNISSKCGLIWSGTSAVTSLSVSLCVLRSLWL